MLSIKYELCDFESLTKARPCVCGTCCVPCVLGAYLGNKDRGHSLKLSFPCCLYSLVGTLVPCGDLLLSCCVFNETSANKKNCMGTEPCIIAACPICYCATCRLYEEMAGTISSEDQDASMTFMPSAASKQM